MNNTKRDKLTEAEFASSFIFEIGQRVRSVVNRDLEGTITEGLLTAQRVIYEVQADNGRFFAAEQKDLEVSV
jgi:S1-C subfamily serine protease